MTTETIRMSSEQAYYENADLWRAEQFGEADAERIAALAHKLPPTVITLLDVGCGNGLFLNYLGNLNGRQFKRLCGADRSAAALARVKSEKVQATVEALPFSDREFDAVSCMEVLEHLPQTVYEGALAELSRIARRYILVSVPFDEHLRLSHTECTKCGCRFSRNYHLHTFNEPAMRRLFDDKGFFCQELFYIHMQKVVPETLRHVFRGFGELKRAIRGQLSPSMAYRSVCPACGYSPRSDARRDPEPGTAPLNWFGMRLPSLLCVKSKWRWISALYERR